MIQLNYNRHEHAFGDAASVAAPGSQGERRLFIYVAACPCGAIEVVAGTKVVVVLENGEVERQKEDV